MSDRDILAGTPAHDLDIWNENGSLDRFKLNSTLANLRLTGELEHVKRITAALKNSTEMLSIDPANSIAVSESKIRELEKFESEVADTPGYKPIELGLVKHSTPKRLDENSKVELLDFGRWAEPKGKEADYSTFGEDFSGLPDRTIELLQSSGFGKSVRTNVPDYLRIVEDARVHELNRNFYTVSFVENGERVFDRAFAARVASESKYNAYSDTEQPREVEFGIILPIEVTTANYYHALSEKVFGMRLLEKFGTTEPIVYTKDPFGLVEVFAEKLEINPERLISFEQAKDLIFKRAALLYAGPYTWTSEVFTFFGQFASRTTERRRKLYISRLGGTREFRNEQQVQEIAERNGYETVYPERLSIDEQIKAFSNASSVLAGHGAGLANIAFMPPRSRIVELFPRSIVKPDYYLRSRGNMMDYGFLIGDREDRIDVHKLHDLLRLNKIVVTESDGIVREVAEYPGLKVKFEGTGNLVEIDAGSVFENCTMEISNESRATFRKTHAEGISNTRILMGGTGSNKKLIIGRDSCIDGADLLMADEDDAYVSIGDGNYWRPGVTLRLSDGFRLEYREGSGIVLNRGESMIVGSSVLLGASSTLNRGAMVSSGSVVQPNSVISDSFDELNVALCGNPARIVARNVSWSKVS